MINPTGFNLISIALLCCCNLYKIIKDFDDGVAAPPSAHAICLDDILALQAVQLAMLLNTTGTYMFFIIWTTKYYNHLIQQAIAEDKSFQMISHLDT